MLVTNHLHILPKVDQILVMHEGAINEVGTFTELMEQNGNFAEFCREYLENELEDEQTSQDKINDAQIDEFSNKSASRLLLDPDGF